EDGIRDLIVTGVQTCALPISLPSYVRRVEPAVVGLRVKARPDALSSQRLGARRAGSAVIFDARGYAVTVTYLVVDAESMETQLQIGRASCRERGEVGVGEVAL